MKEKLMSFLPKISEYVTKALDIAKQASPFFLGLAVGYFCKPFIALAIKLIAWVVS